MICDFSYHSYHATNCKLSQTCTEFIWWVINYEICSCEAPDCYCTASLSVALPLPRYIRPDCSCTVHCSSIAEPLRQWSLCTRCNRTLMSFIKSNSLWTWQLLPMEPQNQLSHPSGPTVTCAPPLPGDIMASSSTVNQPITLIYLNEIGTIPPMSVSCTSAHLFPINTTSDSLPHWHLPGLFDQCTCNCPNCVNGINSSKNTPKNEKQHNCDYYTSLFKL